MKLDINCMSSYRKHKHMQSNITLLDDEWINWRNLEVNLKRFRIEGK